MNKTGFFSRRDFISAAGGLVAVSALPALAEDNPLVFPSRGRFERLALAYQHIEVGASEPFSILHISDTHLTSAYSHEPESRRISSERRTMTFGGRQEEALRDSLAWAKDHVDYVLHTGDLIDWQSEANFDLVRKYFGDKVMAAIGNHELVTFDPDEKCSYEQSFKDRSWPLLKNVFPMDCRFSSKVVNRVNFICLDDSFGTVQSDQVELFHKEAKKGLPIVLAMHVPFTSGHILRACSKFWATGKNLKFRSAAFPKLWGDFVRQEKDRVTSDFIKYLKSEKLLKAILAGHLHITVQDRFSPTATQYLVGGNFMFHGQEITFS